MRVVTFALLAACALAPVARAATPLGVPAATPAGSVPGQALYCAASDGSYVPCGTNGTALPARDPNNAVFYDWPSYTLGGATPYTTTQLSGVRSVALVLTTGGTVTLVSSLGSSMALPMSAGLNILPFIPVSITLSGGAAGSAWMLK